MKILNEMNSIKVLVKSILQENQTTRDDDTLLLFKVWEAQGFKIPDEVASKIMSYAVKPESVRRLRQKIQEESSHLRGKNYSLRHEEADRMRLWARHDRKETA